MSVLQYIAIVAAVYCLVSLFVHFVRVVRLGAPKDKSEPSGSVKEGVVYANTIAMMPNQKESAYLHLPSYATGMLFHIGLFCGFIMHYGTMRAIAGYGIEGDAFEERLLRP